MNIADVVNELKVDKEELEEMEDQTEEEQDGGDDYDYDESDFYDPDTEEDDLPPGEEPNETEESNSEDSAKSDDAGDREDGEDLFSEELLQRAEAAGISTEDAKGFKDSAALQHALTILEKKTQSQGGTEKPPQDKEDEFSIKVDLDDEVYDPELIKAINGMGPQVVGLVNKVIGNVQKKVEQMEAIVLGKQQQEAEEMFDAMVDAASSKSSVAREYLGVGRGSQLGETSAQKANRIKVIEAMNQIASTQKQQGGKVTFEELFHSALNMVFPKVGQTVATEQIRSALKKREKAFAFRPTSTNFKEANPHQDAVSAVAAKLREFGDDDSDFDGDFS